MLLQLQLSVLRGEQPNGAKELPAFDFSAKQLAEFVFFDFLFVTWTPVSIAMRFQKPNYLN